MISVDRRSIVLTSKGLRSVGALKRGDVVACVLGGQGCFVPIKELADTPSGPMLHVFSSVGDFIVSASTKLITTSGPTPVEEVWSARMEADIGRMSGFTVPLETYTLAAMCERIGEEATSLSVESLLEALTVSKSDTVVIRVRQSRAENARKAMETLGVKSARPSHGPAGWSWLRVTKMLPAASRPSLTDLAHTSATLLLGVPDSDDRMPVEDVSYRWVLMENVRLRAVPAIADWHPSYAPVSVLYSESQSGQQAFVQIQSITRRSENNSRGLVLQEKQAYLMLHGHLLHGNN